MVNAYDWWIQDASLLAVPHPSPPSIGQGPNLPYFVYEEDATKTEYFEKHCIDVNNFRVLFKENVQWKGLFVSISINKVYILHCERPCK